MINQMLPGMSKSEELEFIQCGREQCRPGHGYGPAVRDHYLVHYVFKGKGRFYMGGKEYEIAQGGGFFIPPLTLTYYQADSETPWEYAWFGVNGSRAKGLYESVGVCEASPVFFCPEAATHFADIARGENPYATLSSVYGFFSCLFSLLDAVSPAIKPAQHYGFCCQKLFKRQLCPPGLHFRLGKKHWA